MAGLNSSIYILGKGIPRTWDTGQDPDRHYFEFGRRFYHQLGVSNLIDFEEMCVSGVLEPSGPSKSDSWLKNDSFW